MKRAVLILLSLFIVSCGYHLRGSINIPDEMKRVYVRNGSVELVNSFDTVFQYSAGAMVRSEAQAGVIVDVRDEEMTRRSVSLSGTGKTTEFELHYLLDYVLVNAQGKELTPMQTVNLYRNYFNEQEQVIGKANEERVIRDEMYQQAVEAIIRKAQVVFK